MNKKYFEALKQVMDPELNVNIVDLGLVYEVKEANGTVSVLMTLTTPGCPMAPVFETMIKEAVKKVPGVKTVEVNLTFEPPWDASKMTAQVRAALGF